jgi:hypothetical protein
MPDVPAGGYTDAAKAEQKISTSVLGAPRVAFDTRAKSLSSMRLIVNDHEKKIAGIEAALLRRPF